MNFAELKMRDIQECDCVHSLAQAGMSNSRLAQLSGEVINAMHNSTLQYGPVCSQYYPGVGHGVYWAAPAWWRFCTGYRYLPRMSNCLLFWEDVVNCNTCRCVLLLLDHQTDELTESMSVCDVAINTERACLTDG